MKQVSPFSAKLIRILIVLLLVGLIAGAAVGCADTSVPVSNANETTSKPVDGLLKVHYIDVGQGDSAFRELPDGKTILIDAGPKGQGATVVLYIKSLGHSSIDYLVATHPDADHIGGMSLVIESFAIGEVWEPSRTSNSNTYRDLQVLITARNIPRRIAQAGDLIHAADNLTATVLSPAADKTYRNDNNDWSIIIELVFGSDIFLFTGDASTAVILDAKNDKIDVLKVGHHGSNTSTDERLVSALSPDYAVFSVGKNGFGHPHLEVLNFLSTADIFRTDKQGTIIIVSDGTSITVNTAPWVFGQ
ncbi:MAG: MBL fold metallo-hydrolase [Coriobacteriia bacterium]|nr:MBL fold metallo-hydrolase [Coriobacteriia bacterium]